MSKPKARIHLNLTHGQQPDGNCAACGSVPVLVTASDWQTHPEDGSAQEFIEVADEISGHVCIKCRRLIALFFNQGPA